MEISQWQVFPANAAFVAVLLRLLPRLHSFTFVARQAYCATRQSSLSFAMQHTIHIENSKLLYYVFALGLGTLLALDSNLNACRAKNMGSGTRLLCTGLHSAPYAKIRCRVLVDLSFTREFCFPM